MNPGVESVVKLLDSIGGKEEDAVPSPITTSSPVMPVPESPSVQASSLIKPIPYVPVTIAHLPRYSTDSIRMVRPLAIFIVAVADRRFQVWRDACSPLYQCRCTICHRTMLAANVDAAKQVVTSNGNAHNPPPPPSQ